MRDVNPKSSCVECLHKLHAVLVFSCLIASLVHPGSERNRVSGAKSAILKEACHINKSLSTIGRVIRGLVDSQKTGNGHIPYRDSKLTYLLQVCKQICLQE